MSVHQLKQSKAKAKQSKHPTQKTKKPVKRKFELAKITAQGNVAFAEAKEIHGFIKDREKRTLSSTLGAPAQPEGWR